jgi:hypothetical protein
MNPPPNPPARQRPEDKGGRSDHGVQRDSRGEDQPTDKRRAQQSSHGDEQGDVARKPPPNQGQPAGGE